MSKYKVGDVAALFPKPQLSSSEVGKKLQSLFSEFHMKRNKSSVQSPQEHSNDKQQKKKAENEENGDHRSTKKDKKRKFSSLNQFEESSETNDSRIAKKFKKSKPEYTQQQNNKDNKSSLKYITESYKTPVNRNAKKFTKTEPKDSKLFQVNEDKRKINSSIEIDFPRRKKKKANFSSANNFEKSKITEIVSQKHHFAPNFNDSKETKQISGFIKKSKHVKYNATNDFKSNNSAGSENSKVQNLESFDASSISVSSGNNECTKSESKKQKKHKNDFMLDSQSSMRKTDSVNVSKKQASAFDDSDILFKSENKVSGKNKFKKQKRNIGFKQNFQIDTSKLKEPDFIKVSDVEPECNIEPKSYPKKPKTEEEKAEQLTRTIFIANLPTNTTRKALKKLFSTFGPIEGLRFYPTETDKNKIYKKYKKGDPKEQNLRSAAESLPGFVVFEERQSALDALSLNGSVFKDHHITVDLAMPAGSKKVYDSNRSIFIGNLPFGIKDENIWEAFAECGQIEGVRAVRDRSTGIGKGFGYVLFKCVQSKENALALENLEIQGREIRIKPVDSNKKTQNKLDSDKTPSPRDSFKSKAIKIKKSQQNDQSRKSIKKIMKKQKNLHKKKKIASILQKSMK